MIQDSITKDQAKELAKEELKNYFLPYLIGLALSLLILASINIPFLNKGVVLLFTIFITVIKTWIELLLFKRKLAGAIFSLDDIQVSRKSKNDTCKVLLKTITRIKETKKGIYVISKSKYLLIPIILPSYSEFRDYLINTNANTVNKVH